MFVETLNVAGIRPRNLRDETRDWSKHEDHRRNSEYRVHTQQYEKGEAVEAAHLHGIWE
jgi:hypothetical protein